MKSFLLTLSYLLLTTLVFSQSAFSKTKIDNGRNQLELGVPYPIIFVHGLTGGHTTWGAWKKTWTDRGFKFGGRLSYHLEFDDNLKYCNFNQDLRRFTRPIQQGDFYIVNFNTDYDGNDLGEGIFSFINQTNSNQAAVIKQGYVLRDVIQQVLAVTKKEKVVLVGHSMGGLAIREYLQNPTFWVAQNSHRVAKYVSVGTPHHGSNFTGFGLGELKGMDEESDAVRDLRRSYSWSEEKGFICLVDEKVKVLLMIVSFGAIIM